MIRVLIVNCNVLVRIGLHTLLSSIEDIELVGEVANGYEIGKQCEELQPDVILWDLNMPGPQTLELLSFLQEKQIKSKLVVVTYHREKNCVRELISAGITGYVLIEEAETEQAIMYAIHTAIHGGTWFSRTITDIIISGPDTTPIGDNTSFLTKRELQLLELISCGWENTRLAKHFSLSEQTVRNYVSNLYTKLDVHSRAEAVIWARDHGIGEPDTAIPD